MRQDASPVPCAATDPLSGHQCPDAVGAAIERGYAAPIWMTFKQALELGGCVRKGERGSLVVYASSVTRTETDSETGEEFERDIPF